MVMKENKVMGKGTVYLMFAQIIFLVSGYAIHFSLGRFLGPKEYGIFGVIITLLNIIDVFLIRGIRDTIPKFISQNKAYYGSIKKKSLIFQTFLSLSFVSIYFCLAEYLAIILNDITLTKYIRLSAFIIPFLCVYVVYIGILTGLREFKLQACSTIFRSTSKWIFVVILVWIGMGVTGGILGYIFASILALIFIIFLHNKFAKANKTQDKLDFSIKRLISFAIPLVIFSGALTLLMNLDLLFVKALTESNIQTGFYTSALAISRAPYYVFFALSFTLLPSISKSTSTNNLPQTQEYISKSLRYLLMLILPLAFFVSGSAGEVIKLTYSSVYISAASPLSILIFGITFITIFYILATIITGSGNPRVSMAMALSLVPIDIALNLLLIPEYGLEGAATATTITCLIGLIIGAIYVKMKFGMLMCGISFSKILIGSSVLFIIPQFFIVSGLLFIVYAIGMFGVYFLILLAFKELKEEDKEFISRMLPDSIRNRIFN